MTKIRTGNTTSGRPGGWGRAQKGQSGGGLVNKTRAGVRSVTRLFAANPADGKLANIGTKRDVNPSTAVNVVAAPTPNVIKAQQPGRSVTETHKNVVSRSKNRSIRKLR
jgi:hypothetical protein